MDEMGTYFYTKGWVEYKHNIWNEYQSMVKRFGVEKAEKLFSRMFPSYYQRLGVIDSGAYELADVLEKTEAMAKDLKVHHQIIPGTIKYIEKMLIGPWDDNFILIHPGETVTYDHLSVNKLENRAILDRTV